MSYISCKNDNDLKTELYPNTFISQRCIGRVFNIAEHLRLYGQGHAMITYMLKNANLGLSLHPSMLNFNFCQGKRDVRRLLSISENFRIS